MSARNFPRAVMVVGVLIGCLSSAAAEGLATTASTTVSVTVPSTVQMDASACVHGTGYSQSVLGNGPAGYWRMGDRGTVAADASVNNLPGAIDSGTVTGVPGAISGDTDTALSRTTYGKVTVPHNAAHSLPTGVSVEFWVKLDSYTNAYATHIAKKWVDTTNANYVAYLFGNFAGTKPEDVGKLALYANAGGTWESLTPHFQDAGAYQLPLGRWVHVAMTYDTTTGGRLFINGAQEGATKAPVGALSTVTTPLDLNIPDGGALDEVALYGGSLSPTAVKAHYDAGAPAYGGSNDFGSSAT